MLLPDLVLGAEIVGIRLKNFKFFGISHSQNVVAGLGMPNTATTFGAEMLGIKLKNRNFFGHKLFSKCCCRIGDAQHGNNIWCRNSW